MLKTNAISMKSRGYFNIEVRDSNGSVIKQKSSKQPSTNVVTYAGAYECLINGKMFQDHFAAVGTGTQELLRTSTALGNEVTGRTAGVDIGRTNNEVDNLDGTSTVTLTRTLAFGLGSKVGTFSEVGLFTTQSKGSSTDVLIAGQLIKDEYGNPTTITILSDEQLVIQYTLEWVVPNTSQLVSTGTVQDAGGNSYPFEIWSQPFFQDFTIGASSENSRFTSPNLSVQLVLRKADGITNTTPAISNQPSNAYSRNLDEVTVTLGGATLSPSSGTVTDAVFAYVANRYYGNSSNILDIVDTTTVTTKKGIDVLAVIKFLTPISKSSSESLKITIQITFNI